MQIILTTNTNTGEKLQLAQNEQILSDFENKNHVKRSNFPTSPLLPTQRQEGEDGKALQDITKGVSSIHITTYQSEMTYTVI